MQLNATKIEWILQDQIRVLQVGQIFIVQLHASTCISLKVLAMEPDNGEFVQLTRGTEVTVLPPDSNSVLLPNTSSTQNPVEVNSVGWLKSLMPWLDSVSGAEAASSTMIPKPRESKNVNESGSVSRHDGIGNAVHSQNMKKARTNSVSSAVEQMHAEQYNESFPSTIDSHAVAQFTQLLHSENASPKKHAALLNVLICGRKGFGKSTFLRHLAHLMRQTWPQLHVQRIACTQISGRRPEFIISVVEELLTNACLHEHNVVLVDDIDCLCAASQSRATGNDADASSLKLPNSSADTQLDVYFTRVAHIFIEFQRAIRERLGENSTVQSIMILATTTTEAAVHPLLQSQLHRRHYFDAVITLNAPDAETRAQIVTEFLKSRLTFISICCGMSLEDLHDVVRRSVHHQTTGFSVGELYRLCEMVGHQIILQKEQWFQNAANFLATILDQCINEMNAEKSPSYSYASTNDHKNRLSWSDAEKTVSSEVFERLRDIFELPVLFPDLVAACPIALPRGVLLYGVPGSGKTFLCRLVADAAKFRRVFFVKGAELLTKFIGGSEARVRQLFDDARQCRPSLIVFDEFDALAPRRGQRDSTGVTDRVVNQLLAELDGMNESRGISVIATSSRPDMIDDALLRPGRIDLSLKCELPTVDERHAILMKFCTGLLADGSEAVGLQEVAECCAGFTAADLRALVYEAQLIAIRVRMSNTGAAEISNGALPPLLTKSHFESALVAVKQALSSANAERFEESFGRFDKIRQRRLPAESVTLEVRESGGEEIRNTLLLKTLLA